MNIEVIHDIVNKVRESSGMEPIIEIVPSTSLRSDLGFDSLALAELTVRVEERFGIDIFESGTVSTISDILEKLKKFS